MQVGDKVWIFDGNQRVYTDDKGNKLDSCWYRGYFVERYIIGETKVSWIIGYRKGSTPDNRDIKVNKKTLTYARQSALNGSLYISEEEIEQDCWKHDNQYLLTEKVRKCDDYNKLKEIESILNRD